MRVAFALAALVLGSVAAPAFAVGPVLSGTYLFNFTDICQAVVQNSGNNTGLETISTGTISVTTGTATFNGVHKVVIKGSQTGGSLLILQGVGGNTVTTAPFDQTFVYKNNATTLTLGGVTYGATFWPTTGTPTSMVASGSDNAGCATSITAQLAAAPG